MSDRLKKETEFDILGDIFETLRFRGSIFFRSNLAAPWGIALSEVRAPRFHIVLAGQCFVGSDEHNIVRAHQHDIVMLPGGDSHWIADQPDRELISAERAGAACELGSPLFQNGEITNRLVCGIVQFDRACIHPILGALPEIMHFPRLDANGPIWSLVALIDAEMNKDVEGSCIADRLTEVLFLQLLQRYVADEDNSTGFFAALRDRRVHRALSLIHREPEYNWTLSVLGERVGMSRATLVRRFQEIVGMPPMTYINDWRIMKAHKLVVNSSLSIEQIAERTGFASARTLNKSFQRHYDATPTELRRSKNVQQ